MGECNKKRILVYVLLNCKPKDYPPSKERLEEVAHHLRLSALLTCSWYDCCSSSILPCCAITGDGILDAIDWLFEMTKDYY